MKKLCIYHANCVDGFTAAWIIWNKFPDTEFVAGIYNEDPPNVKERDVIIADFSYKRDVLNQMAIDAKSILILDHHVSAEKELKGIDYWDNVELVFDMNRSGAMITWDYFYPDQNAGSLIKHVQDRDLWKFEISQTRPFSANLFSYNYTFENWDMINNICADDYQYDDFIRQGRAIERKHFKDVYELIKLNSYTINILGYEVPILNAPIFYSSDAGHLMSKNKPFGVCYIDDKKGNRVFSLRSNKNGVDVSEIASKFGGGGHKNAAGFRLKISELGRLSQG